MEVLTISDAILVLIVLFIIFAFHLLISRIQWENIEKGDKVYTYDSLNRQYQEEKVELIGAAGVIQTTNGAYTFFDYLRGRIKTC